MGLFSLAAGVCGLIGVGSLFGLSIGLGAGLAEVRGRLVEEMRMCECKVPSGRYLSRIHADVADI